MATGPTPSQTVGPFFHIAFPADGDEIVTTEQTEGERIRIEGRLFDGEGAAVTDAFVEIWQANAHGRYAHPQDRQDKPQDGDFGGYGRCATDDAGGFRFETIRPGRVPGRGNAFQAPHINVSVFARGLLDHPAGRLGPPAPADPLGPLGLVVPPGPVAARALPGDGSGTPSP